MKFAPTAATLATAASLAIAKPLNERPGEKDNSCQENFAGHIAPCNFAWDGCVKITKGEGRMDDCMAFLAAQHVSSMDDVNRAIVLYQQIPNQEEICDSYFPDFPAPCNLAWQECRVLTQGREEMEECIRVMSEAGITSAEDAKRIAKDYGKKAPDNNPNATPEVEVPSGLITVDVYMNILGPEDSPGTEFILSRDAVNKQLDALNKAFEPVEIAFKMIDVTWQRTKADQNIDDVRRSLHRGNLTTLNLFFQKLGESWAGFTQWTVFNSPFFDAKLDGCLINSDTVPGGPHATWNEGKTVVHEVGHWFGQGHTHFTGAKDCVPENRNVSSTGDDACGKHCDFNFMSYGDDACLWQFTSEQITRMRNFAVKRRGLAVR